jgi:hypothetical protein
VEHQADRKIAIVHLEAMYVPSINIKTNNKRGLWLYINHHNEESHDRLSTSRYPWHSQLTTMADDIARQLEKKEKIDNPAGIAECLVDFERRMMPVGLGLADNQEAISADLVREVRLKALPLLLLFQQPGVSVEIPGYTHAGLIRRSAIQTSPGGTEQRFSVVPITASSSPRSSPLASKAQGAACWLCQYRFAGF